MSIQRADQNPDDRAYLVVKIPRRWGLELIRFIIYTGGSVALRYLIDILFNG